jgi:hypothetical protein
MSNQPEKDYEELIAEQLREAGIKFATEKAIAGLAPDFIVYAPDGRQFIVEVKNWDFPGLTTEASRQAQNYQDAVKADGAFIVIPGLKRNLPSKGVVTLDGLVPALQAELETTKARSNPPTATNVGKLVFAAMPFAPQYEDVFFIARDMRPSKWVRYARESIGASSKAMLWTRFKVSFANRSRYSSIFPKLSPMSSTRLAMPTR